MRRNGRVFAFAAVALLGCGGGGDSATGPAKPSGSSSAVTSLTLTAPNTTLLVGGTTQITATAYSSSGAVVTDASPTFTTSDPAILSVDRSGYVSTGTTPGIANVKVTAGSATATISFLVATAQFNVVHGYASTTPAGTNDSVKVRVILPGGAPAPNITVIFTPSTGTTVSAVAVPTGSDGIATISWVLGTRAGAQHSLQFRAAGATQTMSTTIVAAAPAKLVYSEHLRYIGAGDLLTPSIGTFDSYNNVAPAASVTYTARQTAVASVAAGGAVTGVGAGQTMIVASAPGLVPDSMMVVTLPTTGIVVGPQIGRFDVPTDTIITIWVEFRGAPGSRPVGSFSGTVHWDPSVLRLQQANSGNLDATVATSDAASGNASVTFAHAGGVPYGFGVMALNFKVVGTHGAKTNISFTVNEAHSALPFVDLLPTFIPMTYPVGVR